MTRRQLFFSHGLRRRCGSGCDEDRKGRWIQPGGLLACAVQRGTVRCVREDEPE